jgi:hypothetical protein
VFHGVEFEIEGSTVAVHLSHSAFLQSSNHHQKLGITVGFRVTIRGVAGFNGEIYSYHKQAVW